MPHPDPDFAQQRAEAADAAASERQRRDASRIQAQATAALRDLATGLQARVANLEYAMQGGKPSRIEPDCDAWLRSLVPVLVDGRVREPGPRPVATPTQRTAIIAALNGLLGDRLARDASPLAIKMGFFDVCGDPVASGDAVAPALPRTGSKPLLLVHDLCGSDLQWHGRTESEHDHGTALGDALGFTPMYLRYASGLHVSTNGRSLAAQLERLLHDWPQPIARFAIVGHGMGGLLARSAIHYARSSGLHWPDRLDDLVCLGTPHHGAPMAADSAAATLLSTTPYADVLARLGGVSRSPGFTDLCHGNLLDEDWRAGDRLSRGTDRRVHVPLPAATRCHAIAGVTDTAGPGAKDDGLVASASALGRHRLARRTLKFAAAHQFTVERTTHAGLLSSVDVLARIHGCLQH